MTMTNEKLYASLGNVLDVASLSERNVEFISLGHLHPNLEGVSEIVETQPDTPTVDRMLARFNKQWEETAMECVRRAEELEGAALDLRERAARLLQAVELTAEVKGAVVFEINARNRAASLALVNPNGG